MIVSLKRSLVPLLVSLSSVLLMPVLQAPPAQALPPGGAVDRPNGAKIKLDRSQVRAGGRIYVSGWGWKSQGSRIGAGKVVTIKLDDQHILAMLPIRRKRFAGWVRIPRQVRAGRHWLRFLAAKPATSIKSPRFRVVKRR